MDDSKDTLQKLVGFNSEQLIGSVRDKWTALRERGEDGPHALTEDPWRSWYGGWLEGRATMLAELRARIGGITENIPEQFGENPKT